MNGHNATKNLNNLYRSVGSMPYNKKLSYLTHKKINTVHVLEAFLSAVFSFHSGVEHGAIPLPNTWGKYCTSGESRFIIFGIQRCEVVLIFLYFLFPPLRPHPALWLLSRGIFQNINNAEHCRQGNTF